MQVDVDASQARGAGVEPRGPAAALGGLPGATASWDEATVLEDLTGGFNYGSGTVELAAAAAQRGPAARRATACTGCAAASTRRTAPGGAAATYTHPPEIYSITAAPIGARLPPTHASRDEREILGASDGTPGQIFPLRYRPVLALGRGRDARGAGPRVRRLGALGAARGLRRLDRVDRHFTLDLVGGEVEFGPAIRETDGGWTQYGAVPPKGAVLRFTRLPPRRRAPRQRRGRAR